MNRFLLPTLVVVLFCTSISAQDYSICSQVIGASGNSVLLPGQRWTYTTGEAVIGFVADTNLTMAMTIGFHQPEWCTVVSTAIPDLAEWDIRLFPNPSDGPVWIDFQPAGPNGLFLDVTDIIGRSMFSGRLEAQPGGIPLDCSRWFPGVYFLQFTDLKTHAQGTYRLVRI